MILGHEFSGDVVEVGANVVGIEKGSRVAALGYKSCGECSWCREGAPQRCIARKFVGYEFPGGFAEYVSIPIAILNATVFPLADTISYEEGAAIEPLSIAIHVARRAEPTPRETVVVLGAGMIGQCVMQAFKALGTDKVIVSEVSRKRLDVAEATGADIVIDAGKDNVHERVLKATAGSGPDTVVECAGSPVTFKEAVDMVRGGGKIMLVGIYGKPITWDPFDIIRKNIKMIGCLGGSFPRAIDLISSGKVKVKALVTHTFPLDRIQEAFKTQARTDEAVKVLIKP
jgi:2-desacetyl-2-hydroxyethyl bacteriochlorophyllide A dehydrogenase